MKKALILIDIQNDYFPNGNMELVNSIQAGQNARTILNKFRKNNDLVVHIQHIAAQPEATFFIPDTYGVEIHDLVKPEANEKVIIKHYPNSFQETGLLEYLKANHIEQLVIAGMMTHMCVDATSRAAKDFGYPIEIIGDACATRDLEIDNKVAKAEDVQTAFLSALKFYYADIIKTANYLN
ncbi:cysteine hydrolase family protein [Chryseobacterium bernardetii]|uniref:cysteine hydrolase family protein n=1 Tax=Chryseobacterium bernardetii TaxID=1241978 RepID=UPI000F4EEF02|nr:cysteine hydrolase family protein [Chryseobacterium bernardetii]AZB36099.1 cysteine hydrolase [Chryseobacterium bernardetii]